MTNHHHPYTSLPDLTGGGCLDPRIDADIFHPEGPGSRQQAAYALSICARCPVQTACLADTLEREAEIGYSFGIYGNTTEYDRSKLLRTKTSRNTAA
jgi:hypothetical protein